MDFRILVIGFVVFSMFYGCTGGEPGSDTINETSELKKFSSMEELKAFLKSNQVSRSYYGDFIALPMMAEAGATKDSAAATDYSTTNIQVEGVDEADFVKTDGEYLYVLTGDKLVIIKAYPAGEAEILSETQIEGYPTEFFVYGDDLVVFTQGMPRFVTLEESKTSYRPYGYTGIIQYDISDRTDPEVEREIHAEGYYFDSRMIGRHVYVIANKDVWYYEDNDNIRPPEIYVDRENVSDAFQDVYYPDIPAYSYRYSSVLSLDLDEEDEEPVRKIYLLGDATEMYVSQENIYLVHERYPYFPEPIPLIGDVVPDIYPPQREETAIHRIAIDEGSISYVASGSVPGHVLNQFSMDEHENHFRIATTEGRVARFRDQATSTNNVYVLDMDMEVVGELEDLAPGEKIYSARFMGNRCYLVTFRKVDPLFVIDLRDPEEPEVLGKLKIPGYSDYLHPYDENHLIGLGKEAIPADEGDFSWYQGVKLSLFDVSDVEKPKEIAKYDIGDRGTESYALHDHKAFLFSKRKNLLVIPIMLAEIDPEQYRAGVEPWQHGDYTFQGAYVFSVSEEDGFRLKGRVSHVDDDVYKKSGYYFSSSYSVKRSLYIEDILYTISDSKVKMNNLVDLDEIKELELPYEDSYYYE
jgi:inhibitor of cysteine peptidase